jgi:hypothetical protein
MITPLCKKMQFHHSTISNLVDAGGHLNLYNTER